MSSELITKEEGNLLVPDTTKFEQYLDYLGLPTENIIADISERGVIQNNLPAFIESLDSETVEKQDTHKSIDIQTDPR